MPKAFWQPFSAVLKSIYWLGSLILELNSTIPPKFMHKQHSTGYLMINMQPKISYPGVFGHFGRPNCPVPLALDQAEIDMIKRAFLDSARRAVEAGFEAIELHIALGY